MLLSNAPAKRNGRFRRSLIGKHSTRNSNKKKRREPPITGKVIGARSGSCWLISREPRGLLGCTLLSARSFPGPGHSAAHPIGCVLGGGVQECLSATHVADPCLGPASELQTKRKMRNFPAHPLSTPSQHTLSPSQAIFFVWLNP